MEKFTYQIPDGSETVYEAVLYARIELLQARLTPLVKTFAAMPVTARLIQWMLPTVLAEWEQTAAKNGSRCIELTPTYLTGFGFTVNYRDISDMNEINDPMELWAWGIALAEGLKAGFPKPDTVEVCPQYVENGLNVAVGNLRMTVEMRWGGNEIGV